MARPVLSQVLAQGGRGSSATLTGDHIVFFFAKKSPRSIAVRRQLAVETLEGRAMMAGNVSAFVSSGSLYVNGDGFGNGVAITKVGYEAYQVSGISQAGASTRINGTTVRTFYNVSDDIRVSLGNGNDFLRIGGASELTRMVLPDDLFIDMGNGNDSVRLQWLSNRDYNDRMVVNTGWQDDSVDMFMVYCNDYMTIDTAQNWDNVSMNHVTVGGALTVSTGAGSDRFVLSRSIVGRLSVDMGSEGDYVGLWVCHFNYSAHVNGGAGFDTLSRVDLRGRGTTASFIERYA
jgi:hypothetical protein